MTKLNNIIKKWENVILPNFTSENCVPTLPEGSTKFR